MTAESLQKTKAVSTGRTGAWRGTARHLAALLFGFGTLGLGTCSALDLAPLWRGETNSTFQSWTFDTNTLVTPPGQASNVLGVAQAVLEPEPIFASGWWWQLGGFGVTTRGYWDLARGRATLTVPDFAGPGLKEIWLQTTEWYDGGLYSEPMLISIPGAVLLSSNTVVAEADPIFGGWVVRQTQWLAPASGSQDDLVLSGAPNGSFLDAATVDTRYIPSGMLPLTVDPETMSASYVIEASTNLVDWTAIGTNVLDGLSVYVCDPAAHLYPCRFYRAVRR